MSLKRKVAFADEEDDDYRRARAYAKLEDLDDRPPDEDVSSGPPGCENKTHVGQRRRRQPRQT